MEILIEGHSLTETANGYQLDAAMLIPQEGSSVEAALYEVLTHPNIPARGTPHPVIPGINLIERTAEPAPGNNKLFRVKLRYGAPQPGDPVSGITTIRTGSSSHSEQTNVDLNGDPLVTVATVNFNLPDGGEGSRQDEQVHNVDVERPATMAEFERVEPQNPLVRSSQYVGRINAAPWNLGATGTWLCTGIEGDSDDGGTTYKVRYSFQYKGSGWNPIIRHQDPQNGLPAFFNPFPGAIINPARIYPTANFGALGLPTGIQT